ncbi:MAG: glycosyltransferase [Deltaproteobacteria bacterium]|nr:glycosyltransferase [Deltaproteobacteria bacterium]
MKISVVIPVHNGDRFLPEAIESVLGQSHQDFEILLVDDGSTDGSQGIMKRYARLDRRVRFVTQENRGRCEAANRCLEEARYDWVARLDADDVFLPTKIERQLQYLAEHPEGRVIGTFGYFINEEGKRLGFIGTTGPFVDAGGFRKHAENGVPIRFIHSSVMMHRRTVLDAGGYRSEFLQVEDMDLWNRLAERGHLLLTVPEPLVLYRIHGRSVSVEKKKEQELYDAWALERMRRRRQGGDEPSLADFMEEQERRPWHEKAGARRKYTGEALYQKAALYYAEGDFIGMSFMLAAAAAVHPVHVFRRIYERKVYPLLKGF